MRFETRQRREARDLGVDWTEEGEEPVVYNRRQRRQYIRQLQPSRTVRIRDVGFGLWRRHGGGRQRDGWAQPGDDASEARRAARKLDPR